MEELDTGSRPICGEDDRLKGHPHRSRDRREALSQGKIPGTTRTGYLAPTTLVWIGAAASFEEAPSLMREHAVKPSNLAAAGTSAASASVYRFLVEPSASDAAHAASARG